MAVEYEFKCPKCNEVITSVYSDAQAMCYSPDHEATRMKRVYGVAGIHFKGRGFYSYDKKRPGI